MLISDRFEVLTAKSHAFDSYAPGSVAFVTNGFRNNGVQGFVTPTKGDRVFDSEAICVSAFCEATVQFPPFIARGNGGSGMCILKPRKVMSYSELLQTASLINSALGWKFSFGRMVTEGRLDRLCLPEQASTPRSISIHDHVPVSGPRRVGVAVQHFRDFVLEQLFELKSGDYHCAGTLQRGTTPLVSCGDSNNGIVSFVSVPQEHIYGQTITIAYNGQPLTAKFHPYKFAAKDDVAVCIPRRPLSIGTFVCIQAVLNSERWRFSYGRKCFREKLNRQIIRLPSCSNGDLDQSACDSIASGTAYWKYVGSKLQMRIELRDDVAN